MLLQKCTFCLVLIFLVAFISVFIVFVVKCQTSIDPLVSTEVGLIRGLRAEDGDYAMFLGIPFGKVDVDNPFGISTPYPAFEDTFNAFDDSAVCPQIEDFNNTLVGSLDCLNPNIFVPYSATSNNRQSVLVWIHGGGFQIGFNNRYIYGPRFLVKHNIILVTVNYRLGPYGFMCLETPGVPGNQGLKDQLLALRWIKRNIGAFGGDSNKITIFGVSAGSISVDMHIHSNSEKLFDKAILQSGTIFTPIIKEPIKTAPIILSEYLGFQTDNISEALDFLAKVDTNLVIAAVETLRLGNSFAPCIEKEFEGVENFLTENSITENLPKVRNTPILIGFNDDEWVWPYTSEEDEFYQRLDVVQNNLALTFDVSADEFKGMKDIVHRFYFGDEPMSASLRQGFVDFESDFNFIHPTYRSIEKYLDNGAGNIYLYLFSYIGQRNYLTLKNNITNGIGASHCDELGYLFDISYMKGAMTPGDQLLIDQMTTMWTNFVKSGNPTPGTSENLSVQWTPVTNKAKLPCLNIDSQLTLGTRPFTQRATFWDLFYKTNGHLQIIYPGAKVNLS